ncbi:hypothetical protein K0M31_004189 [Melipona bicolor]|uniref:Uncharacterized protein n=1 Tax=Melipona bicolor TaxID=60889 RepID=A0AA40FWT1_9HYME|nr:hypothetical protein K0M31_004189 [Melipona bicolor]
MFPQELCWFFVDRVRGGGGGGEELELKLRSQLENEIRIGIDWRERESSSRQMEFFELCVKAVNAKYQC